MTPPEAESLCHRHDAVAVSALQREGLGRLIQTAEAKIREGQAET
jgi:hypothetical protein